MARCYAPPPTLQSGGENHQCPTSGRYGYITSAVWRVPNASERGRESLFPLKWAL